MRGLYDALIALQKHYHIRVTVCYVELYAFAAVSLDKLFAIMNGPNGAFHSVRQTLDFLLIPP
jgi:hypothetical protein